MITASHNPAADNGVKIIDPDGGMLVRSWEGYACELANASLEEVPAIVDSIAAREGIAFTCAGGEPLKATVVVGKDTRQSSERLCARVTVGAVALGATVLDKGLLTTPQLHHIVRMHNFPALAGPDGRYAGEDGYYTMLADGFKGVTAGVSSSSLSSRGPVHMDCAHGVGAPQAAKLSTAFKGLVDMQLYNLGATPEEQALLNEGVGAEHVQKGRLPPAGFTETSHMDLRCASLDGDADRLVYHTFRTTKEGKKEWRLLDGDKIAVLAAAWLAATLRTAGFTVTGEATHAHDGQAWSVPEDGNTSTLEALRSAPVSVGIVQTAYANGASTAHVRDVLQLPALLAKTGVKFVHHAAIAYDVGVYFEANGHGTVLFHPRFQERLAAAAPAACSDDVLAAAVGGSAPALALRRLYASTLLINQAIGDALSDSMFVEAALAVLGWTVQDWDAVYEDLPSRQTKLAVKDRRVVMTTEDETRVLQPASLQSAIDSLTSAVPNGRAFVRPSGTEDVVRVYAEAATQEQADELAKNVARAAYDHAGGVGSRP